MPKVRKREIDIAKGIGIVLVVICHAMSPVMKQPSIMSSIYSFIYMFHMPLFFFLAGSVSEIRCLQKLEQTRNKVKRLMIPYITWAIIYYPLRIVFSELSRNEMKSPWWSIFLGNNPDGELWFLYVLFIFSLILIWIITEENLKVFVAVSLVVSLFAQFIPHSIRFPGISLFFSLYQIGFYFLGVYMCRHWSNLIQFIIKPKIRWGACMVTVVYGIIVCIAPEAAKLRILMCPIAIVAIISLLSLSCMLAKAKRRLFLDYLGQHSMEIYIIHAPVLIIGRKVLPNLIGNGWYYVIALSAIAITISLLVDKVILSRVQWIGALTVGKSFTPRGKR